MEVSGQLHVSAALPPLKDLGPHWVGDWLGSRVAVDALGKRKSIEPLFLGCSAVDQSLYQLSYRSLHYS
jgi:hypothetical protein